MLRVNRRASEGYSSCWVSQQGTLHECASRDTWAEALGGEMGEHLLLSLPTEVNG